MAGTQRQADGDSGAPPELTKGRSLGFGREFGAMQERPGDRIGPYQLLEVLGEGGFGVVWLAERREPHRQQVALKTLKPGMDSKSIVARFEQERQALACMEHANIARVFDGGATPAGRPYFVMELVKGETLTAYCDRRKLSIRERLELFIPICEAVQHAHSKGVAHRDLKPSNILVGEDAGRPAPKIIDFGIAKVMLGPLSEATLHTALDAWVGTLAYMSPEQAGLGGQDVDLRTDVYSLGVVLYEMLAGVLPFDPRELSHAARREAQRIICEEEPPSPSTRLSRIAGETHEPGAGTGHDTAAIARARGTDAPVLLRQLRRELEWVPLKAMRKERERRYQTAQELVDDIRRYLRNEPLKAGPESVGYRALKFARRRRGPLIAAGVAGLGLIGGGIAAAEARQERAMAHLREAQALEQLKVRREESAKLEKLVGIAFAGMNPAARDKHLGERAPLVMMRSELDAGTFRDHPELEARIRRNLADALLFQGDFEAAATEYIRCIGTATAAKAPRADIVALSLDLAAALMSLGDADRLDQTLKSLEPDFAGTGPDAKSRARFASFQAALLGADPERSAAALDRSREAVAQAEKDANDPRLIADASLALGRRLLTSNATLAEAAEVLRRAEELRVRNFPDDALQSVAIGTALGDALRRLGREDEAVGVMLAAASDAATLSPAAPGVIELRLRLARILINQERFVEAAALAVAGAESARRLGDLHFAAAGEMMLGMTCREMGRFREASLALENAVGLAEQAGNRLTYLQASMHLAECVLQEGLVSGDTTTARGAAERAEPLARRAAEGLASGALPEYTLESANILGGVLLALGRTDEAETLLAGSKDLVEIPAFRAWQKRRVAERMIRLCQARHDDTSRSEWEARLSEWSAGPIHPQETER